MFHPSFDREFNKLETNVYVTFKEKKLKQNSLNLSTFFATFEIGGMLVERLSHYS